MPDANLAIIQDPDRLAHLRDSGLLECLSDPAFDRLTRLTKRLLNAPVALISLIESDRQIFKSQIGIEPEWAQQGTPLRYSFCQHAVASGEKLIIENAPDHALVCDNPAIEALKVVAYAGIPLITTDGFALGTLCAIDTKPRQWTDDEIEALEDIAATAMTEIELRNEVNFRTIIEAEILESTEQQGRMIDQLTILRRVERELSDSLSVQEVTSMTLDIAVRFTRAEHAVIALIEDDNLVVFASIGGYSLGTQHSIDCGIIGRAVRTNTPQFIPDIRHDPDYQCDIPDTRAMMAIPLDYRGRVIGAISLETSHSNHFRRDDFNTLCLIAPRVTSAIDNARLYELSQRQLSEMHHLYMRISELEQLKTDMIRIAAHDLRNPLGGVKGFAELLLEEVETDTQRAYTQVIQECAGRMEKIISDILSLQRIEAIAEMKDADPVDLRDLVTESFHDLNESASAKQLQYGYYIPPDPVCVRGDRPQLREAIDNLVSNAIKYTPSGGQVMVEACVEDHLAVVRVKDTGIGVPAEQQDRLFQPFFRAHSPETNGINGTGLGLHLVKKIVDRHHGRMIIESVYQQGSTFGFALNAEAI